MPKMAVSRDHTPFADITESGATLSADALMGAVIANYVYWVFGDWRFLVPPVIVYLTYIRKETEDFKGALESLQLFLDNSSANEPDLQSYISLKLFWHNSRTSSSSKVLWKTLSLTVRS